MYRGNNLIEPQKCIKEVNLQALRQDARVTVSGYFYAADLGYRVRPPRPSSARLH
jgi:hypothetical protein